MTIQFEGDSIMQTIENRLFADLNLHAQRVVQTAEQRAPKRTGHLAQSIHFTADRATMSVEFYVDASYGMFVEFGTRHMHAHPYLRPAIATEFNDVFDFEHGITFNTPFIHAPLIAERGGFRMPSTLTVKQQHHVRRSLIPSGRHWWTPGTNSAVRRTRVRARRPL